MTIIYVITLTGKTVPIEVESSDFIYNVQTKIQVEERIPRGEQILVFLEEYLEEGRTLAGYGIRNKDTLYLRAKLKSNDECLGLRGSSLSTHFVDLENEDALPRITLAYGRGHRWSRVASGLNIEGKCTQSSCAAYIKRVISPKGFCAFHISSNRPACPLCHRTIQASTFGFTDCEWMYSGRKRGSAVKFKSKWHVAGDEYERFREAGNMADWEVLIITARPNPSPRPECVMCLRTMLWKEDHGSLECGCRFHRRCVASWKLYETHCPTCRVEICTPSTSTKGRQGMPDISMKGREIRPKISVISARPKTRSCFWILLIWLILGSNTNYTK